MVLKSLRIFAVLLIILGLLGIVPLSYFWAKNKLAVAYAVPTVPAHAPVRDNSRPTVPLITGHPVRLDIPSLHMDLAVIDGAYDKRTGDWTLTLDKAQFAVPSAQPNNIAGNTLIYGHYRPQVFAYVHLIKPGAEAVITTDSGYVFTYTYQTTQAYDPTDTSIFGYSGAPRLTIQTCSGTFMQYRQMYYFAYNGYSR